MTSSSDFIDFNLIKSCLICKQRPKANNTISRMNVLVFLNIHAQILANLAKSPFEETHWFTFEHT